MVIARDVENIDQERNNFTFGVLRFFCLERMNKEESDPEKGVLKQ